ncbi:osmoprotectant transport system permease protein [Murinocardiopsis flavida]|uniref:Osmoprotectant transport system permease protein n=1 Tax=Murinocardiopsis flavida TaxID=645275 RepID=A0A2P8DQT2_9ACTN|nr:ABC transporter permease [Murinocardiopsis flavida]PSK99562.1 osmoprotectant transport system permease protein [Murinocardiopsis flavida]
MALVAPLPETAPSAADTTAASRAGRWLRYAGTPAALLLVLGALALYVGGQDLDRIEERSLNAEYLLSRFTQHLALTAVVVVLILAVAIPLGVLLTRPGARRYAGGVLAVANVGQATPTLGLIVLFAVAFVSWGVHTIAVVAILVYGILPVLRNTMVGLDQVDRAVIESARGMGLTRRQVLWAVELPLAVPVMLAGIRTALVITVGTVALATFIGAGGLGDVISNGIASYRDLVLLSGSVLVAVLALAVDWVAGIVEDVLRPRGV